jgi:putative cell wall-binding protein
MNARARRRSSLIALLGLLALPLAPRPADAATGTAAGSGFDGDPATTERINEGDPLFAAIDISRLRFAADGAEHVVLARDDRFADSVAGSGLSGDGPLLFTTTSELPGSTASEIDRVVAPGATVYLLGGTAAISESVAAVVRDRGYAVTRLAGVSRVETAVAVATEVRRLHPGDDVLLARASDWADSVAGGALAASHDTPVLVTPTAALAPVVADWLRADDPSTTTLLGGTAALSDAVAAAVPNPVRVSGIDRTATAVAVADHLDAGAERYLVAQGRAANGWSFGFAAAGLAADADAPILLVTEEVTDATADVVRACGEPQTDLQVIGDGDVVAPALREQLDAVDGDACGPGGALVYPTDLTAFPACADLLASFKEAALERVGPYGLDGGPIVVQPGEPTAVPSPGGAEDSGGDSSGGGTPSAPEPSSSPTNNQEEGVDEPDILKTSAATAYVVNGTDLEVVALHDGAPSVVAHVALPADGSSELLLSGSHLLVLTHQYGVGIDDPMPVEDGGSASDVGIAYGTSSTVLTAIDVGDPAHPATDSSLTIEGDYRSARLVGSVARIVLQSDPRVFDFQYPVDDSREAAHDAAEHNRAVIEATTLDDWLPGATRDDGASTALLDCADVHLPALPSGLGTLSVLTVDLAGDLAPTSAAAIVASGESVYASTSRLFVTTGRWGWEPDALGSTVTTEVHGFDISDPDASTYLGSGSVPGYTIGQYALSELAGNMRIATTLEPPWTEEGTQEGTTESGIHVLALRDGGYREIGSVGGLGRGERIYAVRYFGDLAALVTFRQVDPLFLVDLSDPAAPRVAGELEMTGFASYLHRVGDGRLLGVGMEATDQGVVTGAQVSLFDISDPAAPALVDRVEFPQAYTPVQWDPHAFLFWPTTGLAVVPIESYGGDGPDFLGAVGLHPSTSSLDEVGRVTHTDDVSDMWQGITRSFVSGDVLYTLSYAGLEAADVATLTEEAFVRL